MGGTKTTTNTSGTTTTQIPQEIRDRGTAITNAAMGSYFDPSDPTKGYTTSNPAYSQYQQVGANTTGQLNSYNGVGGSASQQFDAAGSSTDPYNQGAAAAAVQAGTDPNNTATKMSGPNYSQSAIDQYMNPYTNDVVNSSIATMNNQLAQQQTTAQDQSGAMGAFGGDREAVLEANNNYNNNLAMGSMVSNAMNTGYTNAQNQYNTNFNQNQAATTTNNAAAAQNYAQQNSTAQLLANLGQTQQNEQLAAGNADENFGNVVTAQDQAQKTNAYNNGYMGPMDIYNNLAAMNAMQPVNRTSTTTGTSDQSTSGGWLGPALGAFGTIAASDERAKENIEDLDPEDILGAFAKVPPKTYEYKPEVLDSFPDLTRPGRRTGFMAQDLERAFGKPPGPVIDGLKTVDLADMVGKITTAITGLERRTRSLAVQPKKRAA